MKKFNKVICMAVTGAMLAGCLLGCGSKKSSDNESGAVTENNISDSTDKPEEGDNELFDKGFDISVTSREEGSGTRGAFVELFGIEEKDANGEKVDRTTDTANTTNSTAVMMTTVANDTYGIGYISLGSVNDTIKVAEIDGVTASAENVENGTYKIVRPFNICTKDGEENAVAQDFIKFIMSADGQEVVAGEGYVAVEDTGAFESSKPEGSIVVGGSTSVTPVMEKLIEKYKTVNDAADIEIQTTDSSTGVSSTVSGTYDIGMVSRELKDEEISQGVSQTTIAKDGVAVIINNENPATGFTSDQIKQIFTGEITKWEEVM